MRPIPIVAAVVVVSTMMMSGCAVIGPTLPVVAGARKSEAAFDADRRDCMIQTDLTLQPVADQLNGQVSTAQQFGANNDAIQAAYNTSYGACMAARGNLVPAPAVLPLPDYVQPAPRIALSGIPPQTVSRNGPSLTDAVSGAAMLYLQPTVRNFQQACPGETIAIDAYNAPITPFRASRIVALTEPHGGDCFGQIGETDYLVMQRARDG